VRHQPPMTNRPWVLTAEGRNQHLGETLTAECSSSETFYLLRFTFHVSRLVGRPF
jgi:hypothetical protein